MPRATITDQQRRARKRARQIMQEVERYGAMLVDRALYGHGPDANYTKREVCHQRVDVRRMVEHLCGVTETTKG